MSSTPPPPPASPLPPPMTFSRSSSRRELFESTTSSATSPEPTTPAPGRRAQDLQVLLSSTAPAHSQELPVPQFDGALTFDTLGNGDNIFSSTLSESSVSAVPPLLDVGKYRRIAEHMGLRGEQADAAVSLAIMTPRSARVHIYSQVTQALNLITKFREVQVKNWEIPAKVKVHAHLIVRIALIAPIPFCYKDSLPLLVLRILMKEGFLSKDFETKHHQRADVVMKEVARHAGHVRSEIKLAVLASMNPDKYIDILTLTRTVSKACGKDLNITKEVLCAVAYLRGVTALQAEDRTAVALKADEKVWWGLLEHRVGETRARHNTVEARMRHLQDWLENDQVAYGRANAQQLAALLTEPAPLQTTVFEAQRRGTEELKKDLTRTL
uniref:Extracellular metalloproteinase 4 ) n=1 Tax=Ganoderma boninense TaxID=34458 RepID=A0A5K1JZ93_9APHY|nr:Extracellular metalloproteinase 4 (EC (Fungalysin MEP4) [Ganoderma boninense]